MQVKFFVVDAFTDKAFFGNPAGVVLLEDSENISKETMQKLAQEVRFSETAFIRQKSENEFLILYFTPISEIDLCGHATIASFKVLHHLGIIQKNKIYKVHTRAGIIDVFIDNEIVMMEQGEPSIGDDLEFDDILEVVQLLGIDINDIGDERFNIRPRAVSTGLWDLVIPVKSKQILFSLSPNYDGISDYCKVHNIVSFHVFTFDESNAYLNCRDFAPLYGIPEEAATGTANGALIYYLFKLGIVEPERTYEIIQGESMGRPSKIFAKVHLKDNTYKSYVGGNAKIIISGNVIM